MKGPPKKIVWAVAMVATLGVAGALAWTLSKPSAPSAPSRPPPLPHPLAHPLPHPAVQASAAHWPTRSPNAKHDHAGGDDRARRSVRRALQRANEDPFSLVANAVSFILQDVATEEAGAAERKELEGRLLLVLTRAGWGDVDARRRAASTAIATILKRAANQPNTKLDRARGRAIKALGHSIASELHRELVTASAGPNTTDGSTPSAPTKLSWRLLGGFAHKKGQPLPAAVRALDGAEVVIEGYMLTLAETNDIRTFLLVESLWGCCFGKPPDLHQGILVRLISGPPLDYLFTPIQVTGRLEVG